MFETGSVLIDGESQWIYAASFVRDPIYTCAASINDIFATIRSEHVAIATGGLIMPHVMAS